MYCPISGRTYSGPSHVRYSKARSEGERLAPAEPPIRLMRAVSTW
jgi:hypothetical protein